jgi:hypothetical protein
MIDPLRTLNSLLGSGSEIPFRPKPPGPTCPIGPLVGQVAAAHTAVTVFAAGCIRNVADIINPASANEILYVDFVTTAVAGAPTSIPLAPGQAYRISGPITTAVTAVAATAGHNFIAVSY